MSVPKNMIIAIVIVIVIIILYFLFFGRITIAPTPSQFSSYTLTLQQVNSTLGGVWIQTDRPNQLAYEVNYTKNENITKHTISFANGTAELSIEVDQILPPNKSFSGTLYYSPYIISDAFANTNYTTINSNLGNASYTYANYTINQNNINIRVTKLYASDGAYGIFITEVNNTFNLPQGKQLLSDQLSDLGIT